MIQLFESSDLLDLNVLFPELADTTEEELLALVGAFDKQMDGEIERGIVTNPKHRLLMTASYYYNCLLTEWNAKSYVGLPARRAEANERAQRHFAQRHTLLHVGWLMVRSDLGVWEVKNGGQVRLSNTWQVLELPPQPQVAQDMFRMFGQ